MDKLTEQTLTQEIKYKGRILNLRVDKVKLENENEAWREVIEHSGGVCVVAFDHNDALLMVRQFRYPFHEITWEIPAGKINYGEDPKECGARELTEETGYTAKTLESLGILYPTPAYDSEIIHIYYAKDLNFTQQNLDADEFLSVERVPFEKAVEMVMNGEIKDAKTQIAILKIYAMRNAHK